MQLRAMPRLNYETSLTDRHAIGCLCRSTALQVKLIASTEGFVGEYLQNARTVG